MRTASPASPGLPIESLQAHGAMVIRLPQSPFRTALAVGAVLGHVTAMAQSTPFPLWTGPELSTKENIPFIASERSVIDRAVAGEYQFTLGAAIVAHRGELIIQWQNSLVGENDEGSLVRGRRSRDGGATWGEPEMIAPGFPGDPRHCHGVFLSSGEELWCYVAQHGLGSSQSRYPGLRTEAFRYDPAAKTWKPKGTFGEEGFWPLNEAVKMDNGHWIIPGVIVVDRTAFASVALCDGSDFSQWKIVRLPLPPNGIGPKSWEECAIVVQGSKVLLIARNMNSRSALCATSDDYGQTWTPLRESNFPMVTSKPTAGTLSDGRHYLIANFPGENRANRDTLILALSKPGEMSFSQIYRLIDEKSPPPRTKGEAKKPQWAYPAACEFNGKLYIVYSATKEDTVMSVVDLKDLGSKPSP